jgi:hypothetical protein
MGGRTLYCASKLLSVLTSYVQSNTRLISRKSLPSFLLRAAWQLQNTRVANAQGAEQLCATLGRRSRTFSRAIASGPQQCVTCSRKLKAKKGRTSVRASSAVFRESPHPCSRRIRTHRRTQSHTEVRWFCRELARTLTNARSVLQVCVRLHQKLEREASRRKRQAGGNA